jgi:hypothetical protein
MTTYEYSTVVFATKGFWSDGKLNHQEFNARLNKYAEEGWELVNVFPVSQYSGATSEIVAVFKRAPGS